MGSTETAPSGNPTIAPYHTALNGVNQPVNVVLAYALWASLGFVAAITIAVRLGRKYNSRQRLIATLHASGGQQVFWKRPAWKLSPSIKHHLLYAPLWKNRRASKFHPFSKMGSSFFSRLSFGALPSRLHTIILSLYILSNVAYMLVLTWDKENKYSLYAELRGRSGTLAAVNLPPLVLFAGRNNPLIRILNINFDTYNLMHRWIGRTVVCEIIVHAAVWAVVKVKDGGWPGVGHAMSHDLFIGSGTIGCLAMVFILLLSVSPLRSAFYETFVNIHTVLAVVAIVCGWVHVVAAGIPLPQIPWIIAALSLWFAERLARLARLFYFNWSGRGITDAVVEPMPGTEACRVTMRLPRYVDIKPGSHAYIRIGAAHPWENHPFSIAWVEHKLRDALPTVRDEKTKASDASTTVCFLIGAQGGFTRRLYNATKPASGNVRSITTKASFEGPYGGIHSLDSYGHVVLFAGATGITHQLGYARHLVEGFGAGTVSTRRVVLVWIVRDAACLEWIRPWLDVLLALLGRRDVLDLRIHVTRAPERGEMPVGTEGVRIEKGRPDVGGVVREEVERQVGAMAVQVCGSGALADSVRKGVRGVQGVGNVVDFIEESFSW